MPLHGVDTPVISLSHPDAKDISGGFEGGRVVKVDGTYHMFPTERRGASDRDESYDRIKTTVGHWTSEDCIHWKRQSTILTSSGRYSETGNDVQENDRRGSLWAAMPVFNEKESRWNLFYVAYTVHPTVHPNHLHGRIWRAVSEEPGIKGIGGPYKDDKVILQPNDKNAQDWEGLQGIDSFFPFETDSGWLAFYGSAFSSLYPDTAPRWNVGLAQADNLAGPWYRCYNNPVTAIHEIFTENPIVHRMEDGNYLLVMDGGPDYIGLPNKIGYSTSKDGYHWESARYIDVSEVLPKTWDVMRTPLGLVPEGDNEFSLIFNAIKNGKRFHPAYYVKIKAKSQY